MTAANKILAGALLALFAVTSLNGGVRAPQKYHGVVLFDRWDGCYLTSGPYLMYFSKKVKDRLRTYAGKAIVVDAKEVYQPMNPGDGLITKIGSIQIDSSHDKYTPVEGWIFKLSYDSVHNRVLLDVTNSGPIEANFFPQELGIHAFAISKHQWPDPSDDKSTAFYTRHSLKPYSEMREFESGEVRVTSPKLENSMRIASGDTLSVALEVQFAPGQYDLIANYGGGVHESRSVASDMLALDFVDGKIASAYQHVK